jgi:LacI family transcriptional regulator
MAEKRDITIYDLADKLNISAATVSRALNNHKSIKEKTRKRITELAREMGYRSNNFASNLRKQKTNTIGVIVHELNSGFITSVLSGIEKVATEGNYDIIIGHSSESGKKEVANVSNLFHKRVDGLIASLAFDTEDLSHFDMFLNKKIPVVFFDRVNPESDGIKIVIDNYRAGFEATEHLIKQGCTNITHITASLKRNVYVERYRGFRDALTEYNLHFSDKNIIVTDFSEKASVKAAAQILAEEERSDGVFISNDFCAAICIQHFKDAGVRVPDDIAVVGFNNDVISKIVDPKLTTINYSGREMGEAAARSLISSINGISTSDPTDTIVLKAELLIRGSSTRNNKLTGRLNEV